MERIEVIAQAVAGLRRQHLAATSAAGTAAHITQLCDALGLERQAAPAGDVMLGGAYSRLQLWGWDQPELGGMIWLRDDLEPAMRIFAIAHELGHYALHRGEGITLHPPCDEQAVNQQADPSDLRAENRGVQEYTPRARRELEANTFAAELLAPRVEVRRLFAASPDMSAVRLATRFGISPVLAHHRLVDAVLAPTRPATPAAAPEAAAAGAGRAATTPAALLDQLDPSQQAAARADGPALVIAGPGTGKTATLIGRAAHLVSERGILPERVLSVTFSNRAAGEMRERLVGSGLPGARMPVMTVHAFATSLLREYAQRVPHAAGEAELKPDFRILDEADAFLFMEGLLGQLPLRFYRSLGSPTTHLRTLLSDFSRARDGLLTPAGYLALVEAMPLAPSSGETSAPGARATAKHKQSGNPKPPAGTYTAEQIARARERALAYGVWDRELRRSGLIDFGGLIQRAVELLKADPRVLADVRRRYPALLVDEFQDTNHAAGELLMLVAGTSGSGLWVVGDRNQSIYRFRGASPSNLPRLVERYPHLRVLTLRQCYRSVPDIVRLGSRMAARMAAQAPATPPGGARARALPAGAASTLERALRPLELEPVRAAGVEAAIRRGESFAIAAHERVGLAAAIQRHYGRGVTYGDQAVLCRTHKQVREIAAVLAGQGVPVSQLGDFFERAEIKDALMLVALAAGPDARGVLRAAPLLMGLGYPPPVPAELAAVARALAAERQALPQALRRGNALDRVAALSATTRAGLEALGATAQALRGGVSVAEGVARFLLLPGGYAWRLVRVSDGLDATPLPHASAASAGDPPALSYSPAQAQAALAALGELVGLAWRFDARWLKEPDFRARLSRAVSHWQTTRPSEPDALERAPAADVVPTSAPTPGDAPPDAARPTAPAVRCFQHYLAALRATQVTVSVPGGEEDAVHVLTLHQSKGLEFAVVYLPGLAQGQFPAGAATRDEACPPGFRESDAPGEDDAEERCLFYVGVTRARDVVVLTRAERYGLREHPPSALLALVDDDAGALGVRPLFSAGELDGQRAAAAALEQQPDDVEDEDAPLVPGTAGQRRGERPVFLLRDLEQYHECPRQYKYARRYGLLDPAQNAVYRFHRYIRHGTRALHDLRASAPAAQWPAAEAQLKALWETEGPAGHAYDAFYWQHATAILREEWRALTAPEQAPALGSIRVAQPLRAQLRRCDVEVVADRVIQSARATSDQRAPTASETVLVRLHTGRPREDDKKDLALPLYHLAYQQQDSGAGARIALAYVGDALADAEPPAGDPAPGSVVDVTETARQVAEKYLMPDRRLRSTLDKLDEAADGIAAGQFAPHPEERRCAACAYCYVCPADPDDAAATAAPVPATTGRRTSTRV